MVAGRVSTVRPPRCGDALALNSGLRAKFIHRAQQSLPEDGLANGTDKDQTDPKLRSRHHVRGQSNPPFRLEAVTQASNGNGTYHI